MPPPPNDVDRFVGLVWQISEATYPMLDGPQLTKLLHELSDHGWLGQAMLMWTGIIGEQPPPQGADQPAPDDDALRADRRPRWQVLRDMIMNATRRGDVDSVAACFATVPDLTRTDLTGLCTALVAEVTLAAHRTDPIKFALRTVVYFHIGVHLHSALLLPSARLAVDGILAAAATDTDEVNRMALRLAAMPRGDLMALLLLLTRATGGMVDIDEPVKWSTPDGEGVTELNWRDTSVDPDRPEMEKAMCDVLRLVDLARSVNEFDVIEQAIEQAASHSRHYLVHTITAAMCWVGACLPESMQAEARQARSHDQR